MKRAVAITQVRGNACCAQAAIVIHVKVPGGAPSRR
jgi:hypothetical protein